MFQTDTEHDKKNKIFLFSLFLRIFVKTLTHFVDWKVLRGQQGKHGCPVGCPEELFAGLEVTMSQIDTKNDQNLKVFHFSKLLHFFLSNF